MDQEGSTRRSLPSNERDQNSVSGPSSRSSSPTHEEHDREPSDPPDPSRPNKYQGPAQTWRDWTVAERDVARSVKMMQTQDLSVHLYNAHCLKSRPERGRSNDSTKRIWTPPADWTAWPMKAGDVPRTGAGVRRGFSMKNEEVTTRDQARNDLREVLLACITKAARRRFETRECEDCDGVHSYGTGLGEQVELGDPTTSFPSLPSGNESRSRSRSQTRSVKLKRSHSDVSLASSGSSKRRRRTPSEEPALEPTAIADDELAMRIAQPSIEHIVSSLERLLQALHTTRQHYFAQKTKSFARKRTKSTKKSAQQYSSEEGVSNRNRSFIASPSSSSENEADTNSNQPQSPPAPKRKRSFHRYGQRNWKDILGVAAILGWNADALRAARDRCAIVFGERVPMLNLDLNPTRKEQSHGKTGEESKSESLSEDEIFGGVHINGYLRTIKKKRGWRGRNRTVQGEGNEDEDKDEDEYEDEEDDEEEEDDERDEDSEDNESND